MRNSLFKFKILNKNNNIKEIKEKNAFIQVGKQQFEKLRELGLKIPVAAL